MSREGGRREWHYFLLSFLYFLTSHCAWDLAFLECQSFVRSSFSYGGMIGERKNQPISNQGCIFRLTCSHSGLTKDHVLTNAYIKFFRTVTRNAVNKSVWRKKDCPWLPLNKHAMNIWLSSLRIRAHLSWRTRKHLHVLHVLRTYSTCSYPG